MRRFRLIITVTVFLVIHVSTAQHKCATDAYYKQALGSDPNLADQEKFINEAILEFSKQPQNRATKYTIPVVFHIIHTNGPENISREQILDQMRIINADFSYTNGNKNKIRSQFLSVAADAQIRFELAKIDPNGNCTDGINRIYSPLGVEVNRSTEDVKTLVQWNYQKYLNIWVVTSIENDQNGTTLGYAQFPWMPVKSRDGIVMRHDRVGTIGTGVASDSGRTLTHEIGHWLGLFHTFQDECSDGDQCDDTPPVGSVFANVNCPSNGNSCTNDFPDLPDQWENYMDYSNGSCQAMYTANQKTRMHYFLTQSPRNSNVSASNLVATGVTAGTGAPVANFTSTHRMVCVGAPVTFYDISCKANVTARSWTLSGSSVPNSTAENPVVVYQTPGKYKVSLLVQNGAGSNTKSVSDYIEVVPAISSGSPNFEEGFELPDPSSRGFVSVSPKSWTVATNAAYSGNNSLVAPVSSGDVAGTNYSLVLPSVNLSMLSSSSLKFTFYAAYAPSSQPNSEILRVYISTDCGNSFRQILERSGSGLAFTGATVTSNFVPTAKNHWKLMGITSLSALNLNNETNAVFRIDVLSAKGNPVYIDNVNISPYFAGMERISENTKINLYPNPTPDKATLHLESEMSSLAVVELIDITGRLIKTCFNGHLSAGLNEFEISLPKSAAPSLYFVRIRTVEGQITKPINFVP